MAKGLLKKLGLAAAITGSVILGAKEARAAPVVWGRVTDIVRDASVSYGYPSANYSANSVNFTDGQGGATIANNPQFSLIYFANFGAAGYRPVGGLDGVGTTATGFMNANTVTPQGTIRGLTTGQTINQTEGSVDNGYWQMFVDVNGDGNYGTYEAGVFNFDEGEMISDVRVANSQGFQTGVGTISAGNISGWYTVPEPSTLGLLAMGIGLAGSRRRWKPGKK